jgi:hypothetical protein
VLKFRSVRSIVNPAANTGRLPIRRMLMKQIDHTNKGRRYNVIPCARIFATVTRKLMLPKIEPIPET